MRKGRTRGGDKTFYFLIKTYTGSPRTMLVICRNDPVSDMSSPPNEAYAVLNESKLAVGIPLSKKGPTQLLPFRHRICTPEDSVSRSSFAVDDS